MDFRNRVTSFVHGSSHKGNRKIQRFTRGGRSTGRKTERKTEKSESTKKTKNQSESAIAERRKIEERGVKFGTGSQKNILTQLNTLSDGNEPSNLVLKHLHSLSPDYYDKQKPERHSMLETIVRTKGNERIKNVPINTVILAKTKNTKKFKENLKKANNSSNMLFSHDIRSRTGTLEGNNVRIGKKRTHTVTVQKFPGDTNFTHLQSVVKRPLPKGGSRSHHSDSSDSESSDDD